MRPPRNDLLLAAAITAFGLFEVLAAEVVRGPRWANGAFVVLIGALLAFRRRSPLRVAPGVLVTMVVMAALLSRPIELTYYFLPVVLVAFTLGAELDRRRALVGLACVLVAVQAVSLLQDTPGDWFPLVFMALALFAGQVMRSRGRLAAELHEAAVLAEEAREREAEQAVADERRRIAREMHDVVAHSMSVMVIQAGGARRILDLDPGRAEAAADQIERTGREALVEMRRLLGVLRPGEDAREPQPDLDGLEGLVERAGAAGLPVTLDVAGRRPPLPPGLELTAYRIVQEALTNAIKHAGAAPTTVAVRYRDDRVELIVENAPPAAGTTNGHRAAPGHGLLGMRERVRLFAGALDAGERPDGGFRVHASLPVPADS